MIFFVNKPNGVSVQVQIGTKNLNVQGESPLYLNLEDALIDVFLRERSGQSSWIEIKNGTEYGYISVLDFAELIRKGVIFAPSRQPSIAREEKKRETEKIICLEFIRDLFKEEPRVNFSQVVVLKDFLENGKQFSSGDVHRVTARKGSRNYVFGEPTGSGYGYPGDILVLPYLFDKSLRFTEISAEG